MRRELHRLLASHTWIRTGSRCVSSCGDSLVRGTDRCDIGETEPEDGGCAGRRGPRTRHTQEENGRRVKSPSVEVHMICENTQTHGQLRQGHCSQLYTPSASSSREYKQYTQPAPVHVHAHVRHSTRPHIHKSRSAHKEYVIMDMEFLRHLTPNPYFRHLATPTPSTYLTFEPQASVCGRNPICQLSK